MTQKRRRSARRTGRPTQTASAAAARPAVNFIRREIPFIDMVGQEQLCAIETQAEWILQEIGIEFRDNSHALELWRSTGADVNDTRVRLPRGLARQLCETIPPQFIQKAKNPDYDVIIGGAHAVFAPVYGPPFARCLDKGRRYGTMDDLITLVKIVAQLPALHHGGLVICEPCDVAVNKRHLDMLYAHMRYSPKPFLGAITERSRAEDCIEMAKIYFGEEMFAAHCVIMGNVNTNSPLLVDRVVTEAIEVYCGNGQGIIVAPFILGGAMGPLTTAGAVAQALAEALACGAYSQLVKRGAPFVMGNFLSSMNLRSGAPTFGMPEPVLSNYVIGQLARRANLPLRCGGSLTASKIADAQAAYESADSMNSTALAGANFVLHSAGWLEGGLATGFEKLVLDADRLGAYAKLLTGLDTSDNALAQSAYTEVEPAGHFLGSQHTLANYKTAYYESSLSDNDSFEQWTENGSKDAMLRANLYWKKLVDEFVPPPIERAVDEALQAYVTKCKQEREDAWY